jgi:hypothetical protein
MSSFGLELGRGIGWAKDGIRDAAQAHADFLFASLTMRRSIHMYEYMRTTLVLDDQVFRRAKREAFGAGVTLSDLVNTALRSYLLRGSARPPEKESFSMPVFGDPVPVHQSPAELAALRDEGR